MIPDSEMERLLIEMPDILLCPYRIVKQCGCMFYFGSDAHSNENVVKFFDSIEKVIDLLGLEESDKIEFARSIPK